jgi:hypothetical protein
MNKTSFLSQCSNFHEGRIDAAQTRSYFPFSLRMNVHSQVVHFLPFVKAPPSDAPGPFAAGDHA